MAVTHITLQSSNMKDHADNCLVIVLLMINLTRFHPTNVVKKKKTSSVRALSNLQHTDIIYLSDVNAR